MDIHRIGSPIRTAVLVAATVLATTACGNLNPGGIGEATVAVTGDADAPIPAMSLLAAPAPTGPLLTADTDEAEGQVEAEFTLFLLDDLGGARQLGEELEVRLDLRGRNESDVVREPVPAGTYLGLRIVFTNIEVQVQNLIVDGVPVEQVRVELEDLQLPVERTVTVEIPDGANVELLVDLNTLAWLEAVDPITGTVDESVFAGLIDVEVR